MDAKDSSLTSSFDVTVTVTPIDEPPVITGRTTFNDWQENDDSMIETYTALDPEDDTPITWSLVGADRSNFTITNGVLAFASTPDYERPTDSGGDNHYNVTVQATDSNNKRGEQDIDVIVENVDEPPVVEGPDTDDFPENASTSRQVGRYTATDPERATVTLSLTSGDTSAFTLASNGVLTFNSSPDFEDKSSYQVTVRAVAGSHTVDKPVTVNIENLEETGTVSLSTIQPQAGTSLEATLSDDDNERNLIWQWYRTSSRGSTGTAIDGETSDSYEPIDPATWVATCGPSLPTTTATATTRPQLCRQRQPGAGGASCSAAARCSRTATTNAASARTRGQAATWARRSRPPTATTTG